MATSSGWGARPLKPHHRDLICPICLEQLFVPRLLTCLHSFCTKCLNSHIFNTAKKVSDVQSFHCPVCGVNVRARFGDKPLTEWATQFPIDAVLTSMLPGNQTNADRKCEPCSVQGKNVLADYFCTVCREAVCQICYQHHKSSKISKDHQVLMWKDTLADPPKAINMAEKLTCIDHGDKLYEFFCPIHDEIVCRTCLAEKHKDCTNYKKIDAHANDVIKEKRPAKALDKLKKLEKHLLQVSRIKNQNMLDLEADIKKQLSEISVLRHTINSILDELEKRVSEEGTNILKEQSIRNFDEIRKIQSLVAALKNSHKLLETVLTHSCESQLCVLLHKIEDQLLQYDRNASLCSGISKLKVTFSIPASLREVTMLPKTDLSTVNVTESIQNIALPYDTALLPTTHQSNLKDSDAPNTTNDQNSKRMTTSHTTLRNICLLREITLHSPLNVKEPLYARVICLDDDRIVLLDMHNSRCSLYDSCYRYISDYMLTSTPRRICKAGRNEIAITLPEEMKIELLLLDDTIKLRETIMTSRWCTAVAFLSEQELVVSGTTTNDSTYYWGIINMKGKEVFFNIAREEKEQGGTELALNLSKTRVYLSCRDNNGVYCFDRNGLKYFEYRSNTLRRPAGMAIDEVDNLYIAGSQSCNIHRLTPNGTMLQVFELGSSVYPHALCFKQSGVELLLLDSKKREKVYEFQLK